MRRILTIPFRWQAVSVLMLCVVCSLLFVVSGCSDPDDNDGQRIEVIDDDGNQGDNDDQQIEPDEEEENPVDDDDDQQIEPDDDDGDSGDDDEEEEEVQPLSHDEISANLLKKGSVDRELLVGEWDCVRVAYTADGNEISNVATLSKCPVEISLTDEWMFLPPFDTGIIDLYVFFKICHFYYSISGNMMNYNSEHSLIWLVIVPWSANEREVYYILMNTYSFVIQGDELIIYFTGVKNKNLLILKKR